MKLPDWNIIGPKYSTVQDARRDTVFVFMHEYLKDMGIEQLLDYGGGDGAFAVACADLPIKKIVVYDPAPNMVKLAKKTCLPFPHIQVFQTVKKLQAGTFDAATMNALWMCLPTERLCLTVLKDINRLLKIRGQLIASVTHPCFRNYKFSTYSTDFDQRSYLIDGTKFNVTIFDGVRKIRIVDTHWSLSAISRQLKNSGFVINDLVEIPDRPTIQERSGVSPWLVVVAEKEFNVTP